MIPFFQSAECYGVSETCSQGAQKCSAGRKSKTPILEICRSVESDITRYSDLAAHNSA